MRRLVAAGRAGPQATSRIGAICAVLAAACWAFGIVAAKAALNHGVPPLTLVAVQLVASVVVLSCAALTFGRPVAWPELADARGAAFSGVLEYAGTYALAAFGVALTTAGNAAIIGTAEPALIVIAAALILGERVGRGLLVLLSLVTTGLFFVLSPDVSAGIGAPATGDLLVLASAMTGAVYAVFSRRLVASVAPLPLSILQQVPGLLAVLAGIGIATFVGWVPPELISLAPAALMLALLSGLLQHVAAVWLHLHALKRMQAGTFAFFLALVPVFGLLGASVALREPVTGAQVLGGVLILAAAIAAGRVSPRIARP